MKILVIQQKMIGDVLTTSILFEGLRAKYPNAKLHYVVNANTLAVVEHNPNIDKLRIVTSEIETQKSQFYTFLKQIKAERYDVVIDAYSKTSSNLMSLWSGAKTKISKQKWYTSFIYTHTFKDAKTAKTNAGLAIENRLQLLQPLGIENTILKPKIYLTDAELETAKTFLQSHKIDLNKPLFMISVLGSGPDKTYPFNYMAKVLDTLVATTPNAQILFNYIPKQEADAKAIYDLCNPDTQQHIYFEVFGKSLRDFLTITHFCTAVIGNEGGAINMAKALNVPTFTIFSPWIIKGAWNLFEDGKHNVSVHLNDFKPEIYDAIDHPKVLKQEVNKYYKQLTPDLFSEQFIGFLKQF